MTFYISLMKRLTLCLLALVIFKVCLVLKYVAILSWFKLCELLSGWYKGVHGVVWQDGEVLGPGQQPDGAGGGSRCTYQDMSLCQGTSLLLHHDWVLGQDPQGTLPIMSGMNVSFLDCINCSFLYFKNVCFILIQCKCLQFTP